jgi:hypothetical protein
MTTLRNVSELQTTMYAGDVLIHIGLVEVPDAEWPRVYNDLARGLDLPATVFSSDESWELELRMPPLATATDVAQKMSSAVELIEQANEAHWTEVTQMRQIEAAANAWFEAFKRNFL